MVDIDCFKNYNDTYGHIAGDAVIQAVAKTLEAAAKRPGELVARYGGEEFGIILRKCPPANGRAAAEKLRQALAETPIILPGCDPIPLHVSAGVGAFPGSGTTATQVAEAADQALYRAKSSGRNRVEMG